MRNKLSVRLFWLGCDIADIGWRLRENEIDTSLRFWIALYNFRGYRLAVLLHWLRPSYWFFRLGNLISNTGESLWQPEQAEHD